MEFNDSRSKKNDEYWSYLKENQREVSKWPNWMRGEEVARVRECASTSEEKSQNQVADCPDKNSQAG
jgi:hypothetical protein